MKIIPRDVNRLWTVLGRVVQGVTGSGFWLLQIGEGQAWLGGYDSDAGKNSARTVVAGEMRRSGLT